MKDLSGQSTQSQARITITGPSGATRVTPLTELGLTIGRSPESGLIIDDPKASRQHARVAFDGAAFTITDLGSRNRTYLADRPLLPNITEVWPPSMTLRIGSHSLRLELPAEAVGLADGSAAQDEPAERGQSDVPVQAERISLRTNTSQLNVEPGGSVSLTVTVLNQGALVDQFRVEVSGVPTGWITFSPAQLYLMPTEEGTVTALITPPRAPTSRAGAYSLTIRARSLDSPAESAKLRATLNVGSFRGFVGEVSPKTVRIGQSAQVRIENQGNREETFAIAWSDRTNELRFSPPAAKLRLAGAAHGRVESRPTLRHTRWFGSDKAHPCAATITCGDAPPKQQEFQTSSRAVLPPWFLPIFFFLCAALSLIAGFAIRTWGIQNAEAIASATATAATATAKATMATGVVKSTDVAASATAVWLKEDEDKDGLLNGQELELGTDPRVRDTDGDVLDDGQEVTRNTNPLVKDTDDDGLWDGEEVKRGTDPLKKDSDNDGIPDNMDEFPLTPAPFQTQVASATAAAATRTAEAIAGVATRNARETAQAATRTAEEIAQARPDLVVESAALSYSTTDRIGGRCRIVISVCVANRGATAAGGFMVKIGPVDLSWANLGANSRECKPITTAETDHNKFIQAHVDPANTISETNEQNNVIEIGRPQRPAVCPQ